MYIDDWRAAAQWQFQLPKEFREMIINYIMETLKRHLDFSGEEEVRELVKIAVRFEGKNYTSATSQSEYLRKISLKMLAMETESQNCMPHQVPAFQSMQSQIQNPVQQLPIPMVSNQSQAPQQLLSQNMKNIASTAVPNSAGSASAPAPAGGVSSVTSNAVGNSTRQGVTANTFPHHQRPIQGRQQQFVSQDSQQQSGVAGQQQLQQNVGNMMPNQAQPPQTQPMQQPPQPSLQCLSDQLLQQHFILQQYMVADHYLMLQNMANMNHMMSNQAQPPQSQPIQQLPQSSLQCLSDQLLQQHFILQQSMVADHYLMMYNMADMNHRMLNQIQRSQPMTQIQSHPGPMQQQSGLQQRVNNALPGYVQHGIQTHGPMPPMHPRQMSQQQRPQMNSQMQPMNRPGPVMNNSASFHRMQRGKQQQQQQTRLQPKPSLQRSLQSMHL